MKSSTVKVVVKINGKKSQVSVDAAVHDNVFIEAATRVVEKHRKDVSYFSRIRIIGECYERQDEANPEKHYQVNMYHILMNAGFYHLAELLREKTKNQHNVDLQTEPAIAHGPSPENP